MTLANSHHKRMSPSEKRAYKRSQPIYTITLEKVAELPEAARHELTLIANASEKEIYSQVRQSVDVLAGMVRDGTLNGTQLIPLVAKVMDHTGYFGFSWDISPYLEPLKKARDARAKLNKKKKKAA